MTINILMVNYDSGALNLYSPLLAEHGISAHTASTMQEAIDMLIENEYSGVVINADKFEYLPLLKSLRRLTLAPIGVSTTRYDKAEHAEARSNGADLYRPRYDEAEYRAKNFSDVVKIYLALYKGQKRSLALKACDDIEISLDTRQVLVVNRVIKLSPKEFDILHYLVINKGIVISHEQIFVNIWGYDCESDAKQALWNYISQLRKKLRVCRNQPEYIKTKYGVGYSFDP